MDNRNLPQIVILVKLIHSKHLKKPQKNSTFSFKEINIFASCFGRCMS